MARVILDIETVGEDFQNLDELSQEYLLKYAKDEKEKELIRKSLGLYPLTGEIVAIGLLNPDTERGVVYFQADKLKGKELKEEKIEFIPAQEREILLNFWQTIRNYEQFVTFNGRSFDCPYIIIRSAIHKIRPTRNLMPYRYDTKEHLDLLDVLTFYGAVRRKFNLHMCCRAFGIKSPKESGLSGESVKDLFKAEKFIDIAHYCLGDLKATRELFLFWQQFVKI